MGLGLLRFRVQGLGFRVSGARADCRVLLLALGCGGLGEESGEKRVQDGISGFGIWGFSQSSLDGSSVDGLASRVEVAWGCSFKEAVYIGSCTRQA